MIAIDTNVLLRYVLRDDEKQFKLSEKIINGNIPVLVLDMVLFELVWMLKGSRFGYGRDDIANSIHALLKEPNLHHEDEIVVWKAVRDYEQVKRVKVGGKWKIADFPDALLVNKARAICTETQERFDGAYTFEVAAQEMSGVCAPQDYPTFKVV